MELLGRIIDPRMLPPVIAVMIASYDVEAAISRKLEDQ
jgi:hypothetical protein